MATLESSRQFWNEKAKERPYWYVSSYTSYEHCDEEAFWNSGQKIWSEIKGATGYRPRESDCVVEVGCGVGRLTRQIAREAGRVEAFDISEEMLRLARQNTPPNVNFHAAQGASLAPLADRSADFVLAYCVFQHLPDLRALQAYLAEMARVAKSGAMMAFTTSEADWKWKLLPLMRAKGFVKSKLGWQPPGLYKMEWLGIRPAPREVRARSPIALERADLGAGRWLYFGTA